ncbi:glc operon protein GlcG [Sphingobium faniae]|nr:glc operon protein GlcG [Sphingobium faniae]
MYARHVLGSDDCRIAMDAALNYAQAQQWRVTVAIVDNGGGLLALVRMDTASVGSIDGAIEKARSAALTGVETRFLEQMVAERPAIVTMRRVAVEGGLPLLYDGQCMGGIGVSGVQSHQDAEVARTGVLAAAAQWNR